ncbi:MAG: hypothetical protein ACRCU0_04735 [Candidatus Rhabdochlamydia sp.]
MTVTFNPSGIIHSLEYNLHKGVSRSKTDNQKQIEDCMAEADKIVEQKNTVYRREAMFMIAFAVGTLAFSMLGAFFELQSAPTQGNLDTLKNQPGSPRSGDIQGLTEELGRRNFRKSISNGLSQLTGGLSGAYSNFEKISHNQLDHQYKKKDMRWSQLQQELNNPSTQSLLNDVKEMKRRQQRAKEAAG